MIDFPELYRAADTFVAKWGSPPAMEGRGIVTTLYDREFASGYILLCELKRLGVNLPIEVFYRPGELSPVQISLVENLQMNLTIRVLEDEVTGFAIKVFAIVRSRFREVLWLDADNAPIRDPSFLFNDPEYLAKGSLFWRDVSGVDRAFRWHHASAVWKFFRVPYHEAEEFDTGQIVIDKARCWQELGLTAHYNLEAATYHAVVHGDKDTFRLAWMFIAQRRSPATVPYGFMPFGPFHIGAPNPWGKWGGGTVMQQRDREGRALFNHRTIDKFTLNLGGDGSLRETSKSWMTYGPDEEEYYLLHLGALRAAYVMASRAETSSEPSFPPSARVPSLLGAEKPQIVWLPPVL